MTPEERDPHGGLDFAWRVHGMLDSWTGKVDTKASITLAIESGILGFVLSLSKKGERLAALDGLALTAYRVGAACLVLAVFFSLRVVTPQLNRRAARKSWHNGMIYFGHLRRWDPETLAASLKRKQTYEVQLADQLVAMSKIAWKKHTRLQWSVGFLMVGGLSLLVAVVAS